MDYPEISVLIATYERWELLKECLAHLESNLRYAGEIRYVLADDGDTDKTSYNIDSWFDDEIRRWEVIGGSERLGLGGNVNRALKQLQTDIVLQLQDDYFLRKPLELTPHVERLLLDPTAGWIRLRLLNGQRFTATVEDRYWRVNWFSEEGYICSDQPHLKHMRFHQAFGYYPEGLKVADTENEWCWRVREEAREKGGPGVLVPTFVDIDNLWTHEGDGPLSWKDKGL